jgi:formylglycine-generating enzyme required for sulfatase activity
MDNGFADVIQRMVGEQGNEVLVNGRAKAYLSDYCAGQFKKEEKIFRQILEAGCGEIINSAGNVLERKLKLMERLEDDNGLSPKVTADYLDLLGLILKGDSSKCGGAATSTQTKPSITKSAPLPAQTQPSPASKNKVPDSFVWIEGGTFMMGSPNNEPGRVNDCSEFQDKVKVTGFFMGKYQVTQKEYQALMGVNPSHFKGENLPVENVSWYDAVKYCNKLNLKEGLSPAYEVWGGKIKWNKFSSSYRLPTEAEWEYACRAGTTTAYNTGANISDNTGWYVDNSGGKTHPVGQKPANAWGLFDMHGNVWEWCSDWYEEIRKGAWNPGGADTGTERATRGGSWADGGEYLRSACRFGISPKEQCNYNGFRLVLP